MKYIYCLIFIAVFAVTANAAIVISGETIIEAEDFSEKSAGTDKPVVDGWGLLGEGYIRETLTAAGEYFSFKILAKGLFAGGAWPIMEVRINGSVAASFNVDSSTFKAFEFIAVVPVGDFELDLAFINDYYEDPADRNLYIDKVIINAKAGLGSCEVTLAWDSNTEPDLAGYRIYVGLASGDYDPPIDVGNVNETTLTGLIEGTDYYFAATAYDLDDNESAYSDELPHTCNYVIPAGGHGLRYKDVQWLTW